MNHLNIGYKYRDCGELTGREQVFFNESPAEWAEREIKRARMYDPLVHQMFSMAEHCPEKLKFREKSFYVLLAYYALRGRSEAMDTLVKCKMSCSKPMIIQSGPSA